MRSLIFVLLLAGPFLAAQEVFLERDGIVRVDLESTACDLGQWEVHDTLPGAIGGSYLEFRGPNFFNTPGNSTLNYKVRITTVGTYLFRWHSRITEPGETTDFNDSWLRCPDADDFFARVGNRTVYPRGTGRTPNPEGSSSNGWFKAYQNRADAWNWRVSTSDNDPHDIFMTFNTPGDYTVQISGRSFGHAIDRFVLVHSSASVATATSLSAPESERATVSLNTIDTGQLRVFPVPVRDYLNVELPTALAAGNYELEVRDVTGRSVTLREVRLEANQPFRLATDNYASGTYLVILRAPGWVFTAPFTK
ncbi:T9SS type A sorting domain-containing protein [Lewinella sp. 4G2]|uniref:T9SS type A sorting domain-containing protein n=1 Tax=Lewinella sp. 4G2 TaxID=1803372 RepID=UPI0007B49702|nr:T9SS type A sorting domain-containing protein [Lewinella sp. 4G2]OAV43135.1 hypothetical protein A3850_000880 [Lewinella sp. 4G2]